MAVRRALVSGISLSLGCGMGAVAVSTMRRDIVDLQVDLSTSVRETHSQINPTIVPIYNPTVRENSRAAHLRRARSAVRSTCALPASLLASARFSRWRSSLRSPPPLLRAAG